MFNISIKLPVSLPPKNKYSFMRLDDIYEYISWDATLTIKYNNIIVFSEDIAIIEFYWYLTNWINHCKIKEKIDFIYSSVEAIEPILSFSHQAKNYWVVSSIWMQTDDLIIVEENLFFTEINKLVEDLKIRFEI